MPVDRYGLTPKQRKFCDLYVKTNNGAASARDAGYSKNCARVLASETLAKPYVKKYVDMKMNEAIEKIGVTKEWRLEILQKAISISLSEKEDEDGNKYYPQLDLKGIKGLVNEMNKMAGDHAPTTSNLNVANANLDNAQETADNAEKEIEEIKSF